MNIRSLVTRALPLATVSQQPAPTDMSAIDSMASVIFSEIGTVRTAPGLPSAPAPAPTPAVTTVTIPYVPQQLSCPGEGTLPCSTFGITGTPSFSLQTTRGVVATLFGGSPTGSSVAGLGLTLDFVTPVYTTAATLALPKGPQPSTYTRTGLPCQTFVVRQIPYSYDTMAGIMIANGSDPAGDVALGDLDENILMSTMPQGFAYRMIPDFVAADEDDPTCFGGDRNLTFAAATDVVFVAPPPAGSAPAPTQQPPAPTAIGPATSTASSHPGHHLSSGGKAGIAISVVCAVGAIVGMYILIPKARSWAAARNPRNRAIQDEVRRTFELQPVRGQGVPGPAGGEAAF